MPRTDEPTQEPEPKRADEEVTTTEPDETLATPENPSPAAADPIGEPIEDDDATSGDVKPR